MYQSLLWLDIMEQNQLALAAHQTETDHKLEEVFRRLDSGNVQPHQGKFPKRSLFSCFSPKKVVPLQAYIFTMT